VVDIHDAWQTYVPATLPEEVAQPAPSKETVLKLFPNDADDVASLRLSYSAQALKAAVEKNPKDEDALLKLGLLYAEHGRLQESAQWLDKLLAADPSHAAALNDRANVYLLSGDAAKAQDLYTKASAADPKDGRVLLNLARAAAKAGDKAAAEKAFKDALAASPELKDEVKDLDEIVP
jgi:tetratricopeptide (TPR) repeat protein